MSEYSFLLSSDDLGRILKRRGAKIYFIGIMGAGMLPLAKLMCSFGFYVSGSDILLKEEKILHGMQVGPHNAINVDSADLIVTSFAIAEDNEELIRANELGIFITSRAALLGFIMLNYRTRIGVSGSHGKSTTTAIIDKILCDCGYTPTTISGATLYDGVDMRIGSENFFVYEACEYRDAFLNFHPSLQVITSIELDHTDYFDDIDAVRASFKKCADSAGYVVLNLDFDGAQKFKESLTADVITYGSCVRADYRYEIVRTDAEVFVFDIYRRGKQYMRLSTHLIGKYNIANITAAVAIADYLGIDADVISRSVSSFCGIERRMSILTTYLSHDVFYDYAHHPTEISAAINAIKERYGTCTVVFCPHTYSRTKSLWGEFISALSKADFTILLDIYPAREKYIDGVTSQRLAKEIGDSCVYATPEEVLGLIETRGVGAVVLMGAGRLDDVIRLLKNG